MGTPLATIAELRAIEQAAQSELPAGELMARAGRAAAHWIDAQAGDRPRSVLMVAGPGNNGGDGFVTASELVQRGHQVECVLLGAAEPGAADARAAFDHWRSSGGGVRAELPQQCQADLIVDALFGIGLARPLSAGFAEAVLWINAQESQIVSLDVPSGLDADRGSWIGDVPGVRANATVTFIADKPGLRTGDGVDACGEVVVQPLGVATEAATGSFLTEPNDFDTLLQTRGRNTHKGTYGDTLIVGGGTGMVGAPLLAARAALRSGAGRVYVDCLGAPELSVDPLQPELMFRRHTALAGMRSIVIGCGLGLDDKARAALGWSLASEAALVIDADGLNILAQATTPSAIAARRALTVLTPHPLEAARLLRSNAAAVQADRIGAARALAREHDCVVVLKGAGSVIARADGRFAINPTGGPALATAGTGDVLAGLLGGFLAQGYDAWPAALAAVWLHGAATKGEVDRGLVASDIAPRAMKTLRALQAQRGQRR